MRKKVSMIAIVAVAVVLVFVGCQPEEEAAGDAAAEAGPSGAWSWVIDAGDFPEVNALEVKGDVIAAGSSTVFPAAEYLAAQFQDEGYSGNITIDSIGSGGGFERFTVAGESDVSHASRPIKDKELEQAREIGREPIEFRIGTDALAVVVNPENDWVTT